MLVADGPMEGACQPCFQEPHNMMAAREEFGRRLLLPRKDGNLMLISLLFQSSIPFPAIGHVRGGPWHAAICAPMSTRSRNSSGREPVASREHWLLSSKTSPTRST